MPKVVGMYESSRKGLKHNLGGFFGRPKKQKQMPGPELEDKRLEDLIIKPEPKPKPKDAWTESTKKGLAGRRRALKELTKD